MPGGLFRVFLVLSTVLVLGAGTAHATPLASAYTAVGGPVPGLGCASSHLAGGLDSTGTHFVDVGLASYQDCVFFIGPAAVTAQLPWQLVATGQSGTVTQYAVSDIAVTVTNSWCRLAVAGTAGASFDSATSVLTVAVQSTVVTYVDPSDDCLGLATTGQLLPVLSGSYAVALH